MATVTRRDVRALTARCHSGFSLAKRFKARADYTPAQHDLCQPRSDVLAGRVADADLAADLAAAIGGTTSADYSEPARFFANTYPTRGSDFRLWGSVTRAAKGGLGPVDGSRGMVEAPFDLSRLAYKDEVDEPKRFEQLELRLDEADAGTAG